MGNVQFTVRKTEQRVVNRSDRSQNAKFSANGLSFTAMVAGGRGGRVPVNKPYRLLNNNNVPVLA